MNAKILLVPVDFSDVTDRVTDAASTLALAFEAKIVLLHVEEPEPDFVGFEPGPPTVRVSVAHAMQASHQQLESLKAGLAQQGATQVTALHIQGPTVQKILHEAEAQHADIIVMGSHGHGALYNLLVGSVASGVMKASRCPVLVVPSARP